MPLDYPQHSRFPVNNIWNLFHYASLVWLPTQEILASNGLASGICSPH